MYIKKRALKCYIEIVLDNFGTNGEQIAGSRNLVLQRNDENFMGRSCNKRRSVTKSWNRVEDYENHKKEIDRVLRTCHEERRLRRIDAELTCKWQAK